MHLLLEWVNSVFASRVKAGASVLGLCLLLIACAKEQPPGVAVKRVAADIAFGLKQTDQTAGPAGLTPGSSQSEAFTPNLRGTGESEGTQQTEVRCREAGPNDFPKEQAPLEITGTPKEGVYQWKLAGRHQPPAFPFPLPLGPYAERAVREVRADSAGGRNFTFQTVEKEPSPLSRTIITSTFRVDVANANSNLRGVFLTRVANDLRDGSPPRVFTPSPAILYLPLPVIQGQDSAWRSVGVDTSGPTTLTHLAYVKDRQRIDACGTVIDSWLVDADQTITTSGGSSRRNYNYSIATQFGGLIIFEHVESPCAQSTPEDECQPQGVLKYDTNIGETEPDSSRKDIR